MSTHCEQSHSLIIGHAPKDQQLTRLIEWLNLMGKKILTVVKEWNQRYKNRQELYHLSDRDLKDIGLTRLDVKRGSGNYFWNI